MEKWNDEIAKDAIEDAIENRRIRGQSEDGGLDEALKIIKERTKMTLRGCPFCGEKVTANRFHKNAFDCRECNAHVSFGNVEGRTAWNKRYSP